MTESDRELIQAASRRGRRLGRPISKLRVWLEANYDLLLADPPHWPTLARNLHTLGLRDAYGTRLTAHRVAATFSRIKVDRDSRQPGPKPERKTRSESPSESGGEPFQIRSIKPKETP
jgi:hypothetical protein